MYVVVTADTSIHRRHEAPSLHRWLHLAPSRLRLAQVLNLPRYALQLLPGMFRFAVFDLVHSGAKLQVMMIPRPHAAQHSPSPFERNHEGNPALQTAREFAFPEIYGEEK